MPDARLEFLRNSAQRLKMRERSKVIPLSCLTSDVAAHFHIQFKISLKIGAAVAAPRASRAGLPLRGSRQRARQRLATVIIINIQRSNGKLDGYHPSNAFH